MRKVVWVRVLVTLQALHVFFGILWFGGAMYANFVVIPATNKIEAVHANAFAVSYGKIAERFMTPVSILTLLFGIILGFPLGAWDNIGHIYGNTYLAAFLVALVVWLWGMLMIGRNIKKSMKLEEGSPESVALMSKVKQYAVIELLGFLILFVLMVALRFGY